MSKKNIPSPCETAAERIHHWFDKDKEHLLLRPCFLTKASHLNKKHLCTPVKTPKVPSQIQQRPLEEYVFSKKKKAKKKRQVTRDGITKPLLLPLVAKNLSRLSSLTSSRVAHCHLKEQLIACKKLKALSKIKSSGLRLHKVAHLPFKPQPLSNPYLQEWGKRQEERHYQFDRVIKYLID